MSSFYQTISKEIGMTPISVVDFRKYHKHVPRGDEAPHIYKVMMLNNEKYKFFEDSILSRHVDTSGKILCEQAALLWMVYDESAEVIRYNKFGSKLRVTDPEIAKWWIKTFEEKSVDELYEFGVNTISSAWGIVVDYFREWMVSEKYERIYSKSNDYEVWVTLARENKDLLEGREMPFDMPKISEKAKAIINVRN